MGMQANASPSRPVMCGREDCAVPVNTVLPRASVTTYAANNGAQRFYERRGFAVKSVILDLDDLPRPGQRAG